MSLLLQFELELRNETVSIFYFVLLFASLSLISAARMINGNIFKVVVVGHFRVVAIRSFLKENLSLNRTSSYLLLLNYTLSGSFLVYSYLTTLQFDFFQSLMLGMGFTLFWLGWDILQLALIGWFSGEFKSVFDSIIFKVLESEFIGLIFSVFMLIIVVNPTLTDIILLIAGLLVIALWVFRIFKSIMIAFRRSVPWYYIILYLCTLEILPFFVGYYAIKEYFVMDLLN